MPAVQLFATCLGDLAFPDAVADAESLLRRAGYDVEFPARQVCCGQPAFNSGHRAAARRVARSFVQRVLAGAAGRRPLGLVRDDGVALPPGAARRSSRTRSGSCRRSSCTAGFRPLPRNDGRRIAYHDSCHMLRELGISAEPRRLLGASGAELVPFARPDLCCGFGGTFSVRQPEVSLAMADDKLAGAPTAAAIVTADPGCLMHLRGRAEKVGSPVRVVHLATRARAGRA